MPATNMTGNCTSRYALMPMVAEAPPVQVARRRMMDAVRMAPLTEGGEHQEAQHRTDDVHGFSRSEIRAMAAVMEKNENPDKERPSRQCEQKGHPHRPRPYGENDPKRQFPCAPAHFPCYTASAENALPAVDSEGEKT